jgi:membrane-bound lytic murein transglycosylase D
MQPADAARRVGMSEKELRDINRIPNGVVIKAGSTLLVVRPPSVRHDVAEQVADNGQLTLSPLPLLARKNVRAAKGDTVASVARRYRVSAANVADWNNVAKSATFRTGQALTLYVGVRSRGPMATARSAQSGKAKKTGLAKARAEGKPIKVARH